MHQRALLSRTLMDLSELRIDQIRWGGSDDERQVVNRLFESPSSYRHWEAFHGGLMRRVGGDSSRKGQLLTLRQTRFELIHRQALFEFLRESSVTGRQRNELFGVLHGTQDYTRAVLAEHARYLQSNSSLFCADHLSFSVMGDLRFSRGLERYRRHYLDYFGHYCRWILSDSKGKDLPDRQLLPQLKAKLQSVQQYLLALPAPRRTTRH